MRSLVVLVAVMAAAGCGRSGLRTVIAGDNQFVYVNRSGRQVTALTFDNGADYFVEGRARYVRNGKVGFIDRRLREVIPAAWDFAFPFEKGRALVCNGCAATGTNEHRPVTGGVWGYVDRDGRVVVPVTLSLDEVRARAKTSTGLP